VDGMSEHRFFAIQEHDGDRIGHNGSRAKGCSKTYLAAKLVMDGKAKLVEAAERFGIRKQTVSQRLIKNGFRIYKPKGSP
jgi:hypothetical protein